MKKIIKIISIFLLGLLLVFGISTLVFNFTHKDDFDDQNKINTIEETTIKFQDDDIINNNSNNKSTTNSTKKSNKTEEKVLEIVDKDTNILNLYNQKPDYTIEIESDTNKINIKPKSNKIEKLQTSFKNNIITLNGPDGKWIEDETYTIKLNENQKFINKTLQPYKEVNFTIRKAAKTNIKTNKKIKIYTDNQDKQQLNEISDNVKINNKIKSVKDIPKEDIKENNIVIISKNGEYDAVKIVDVKPDGTFKTVEPELNEIFEDFEWHENITTDDWLEDGGFNFSSSQLYSMKEEFRNSYLYDLILDSFIQEVYAENMTTKLSKNTFDDIKASINKNLPIEIDASKTSDGFIRFKFTISFNNLYLNQINNIQEQTNTTFFKQHEFKLVTIFELKPDILADFKSINNFKFVANMTTRMEFQLKIKSTNLDLSNQAKAITERMKEAVNTKLDQVNKNIRLFSIPIPAPILITISLPIELNNNFKCNIDFEFNNKFEHVIQVGIENNNGNLIPKGDIGFTYREGSLNLVGVISSELTIGIGIKIAFVNDSIAFIQISAAGGIYFELKGTVNISWSGAEQLKYKLNDFKVDFEVGAIGKLYYSYKLGPLSGNNKSIMSPKKISWARQLRYDEETGNINITNPNVDGKLDSALKDTSLDDTKPVSEFMKLMANNITNNRIQPDMNMMVEIKDNSSIMNKQYKYKLSYLTNITCYVIDKNDQRNNNYYTFDSNGTPSLYSGNTLNLLTFENGTFILRNGHYIYSDE